MKTISFAVPCYNSAAYMDKCIESLLRCGDDIEIILVNDGSQKDNTSEKAHEWEAKYPGIIRAIDQENRGHGGAVNHGLAEATGLYFKVVDSDDWLDDMAMLRVMNYLRRQVERKDPTDLVVANYVYEKVHENASIVMNYRNVFPVGEEFTWDEVGHFRQSQYLLMHSVIYRTQLLKDCGLQLPEHCFYVDNIFVYVHSAARCARSTTSTPTCTATSLGREDQASTEKSHALRVDQQLRVTRSRSMRSAIEGVPQPKLAHGKLPVDDDVHLQRVFAYGRHRRRRAQARRDLGVPAPRGEALPPPRAAGVLNMSNLPTKAGRKLGGLGGYHRPEDLQVQLTPSAPQNNRRRWLAARRFGTAPHEGALFEMAGGAPWRSPLFRSA